jgi:hypothetical protein
MIDEIFPNFYGRLVLQVCTIYHAIFISQLSKLGVCCFTLICACVCAFMRPIKYRENRWDYFTEIWCEDTYGDFTYFLASRWPSWKSHFYGGYVWWSYITYYTGFLFDLLFKVTEVKVRKKLRKLSCFVIIWCTMFLLCVVMYISILYPIPEFWSNQASNMEVSLITVCWKNMLLC